MEALEVLAAHAYCLEGPLMEADGDRASEVSSGDGSDDKEPDPSTSPRAAKTWKKNTVDLCIENNFMATR